MTPLIGFLPSPSGPLALVVVALIGAGLGRLLTAGLDRVFARPFGDDAESGFPPLGPATRRFVHAAALLAAVATWWWEVVQAAAVPTGLEPDRGLLAGRWAGHAILFALLAAAALVDLRHRVVPDLVTVPGVALGLVWAFCAPATLPPISVSVPRTFAAPLDVADVLGLAGGLHAAGVPAWLGPRPALAGLAILFKIWVGWWLACTAPFLGGDRRLLREPRNLLLVAGAALLIAAWWIGGDRWTAIATALVGLAVGGGMIWGIRFAASRAVGREAMGMGDVTLMAMIGTWLGWQPCLLVLYCTVFIGLVHALVHLVRRGETEFPFGPSLCMATAVVVLFWRPLWDATGSQFEDPWLIAALAGFVILGSAGVLWTLRIVRERRAGGG
jgi:prepilin signal peptidase PulO-like enzyme (type II secretory pathway)